MDHSNRILEELIDLVRVWQKERYKLAGPFTMDGLREFSALHNAKTRQMISLFQITDPDFYSALVELATHAQTHVTPGAKFIVNKHDRTNT